MNFLDIFWRSQWPFPRNTSILAKLGICSCRSLGTGFRVQLEHAKKLFQTPRSDLTNTPCSQAWSLPPILSKAWHCWPGELKALSHEAFSKLLVFSSLFKTPSGLAAEEILVIQRNQRMAKQIARRTGSDGWWLMSVQLSHPSPFKKSSKFAEQWLWLWREWRYLRLAPYCQICLGSATHVVACTSAATATTTTAAPTTATRRTTATRTRTGRRTITISRETHLCPFRLKSSAVSAFHVCQVKAVLLDNTLPGESPYPSTEVLNAGVGECWHALITSCDWTYVIKLLSLAISSCAFWTGHACRCWSCMPAW